MDLHKSLVFYLKKLFHVHRVRVTFQSQVLNFKVKFFIIAWVDLKWFTCSEKKAMNLNCYRPFVTKRKGIGFHTGFVPRTSPIFVTHLQMFCYH